MTKQIIIAAAIAALVAEAVASAGSGFALPPLPEGVLTAHHAQSPAIVGSDTNTKMSHTFMNCGGFCGYSWCGYKLTSEKECVDSGRWAQASFMPNSAVDSCCKDHDRCCVVSDRDACNRHVVSCVQSTMRGDKVCGITVWSSMRTAKHWCCGGPCPVFSDPALPPPTPAGKVFADERVRITFADDATYTAEAVLPDGANGLRLATETSACAPQPFSFAAETLQLHLGAMMHIDTNACGKKLMAASPAHDVHPLLDSPELISYWPYADVIAVTDKTGTVSEIPRVRQ